MQYHTTLLMSHFVTHDVKRFVLERPEGFSFTPGQGIELVIDEPRWRDEKARPFTPTGHPDDRVLEFTIKRYADHGGVTDRLHSLPPGTKLLITEPFGAIHYKGPGIFLAAGAGITPFLAIFRQQARQGGLSGSRLLFSNKTPADVICEKELRHYFGEAAQFTCTRVSGPGYGEGRIDQPYLEQWLTDRSGYFYVCGPDLFVEEINAALRNMGIKAESLVFEQ
jgi:cytochrome-b5 reductase